jgi:hypothetical protein
MLGSETVLIFNCYFLAYPLFKTAVSKKKMKVHITKVAVLCIDLLESYKFALQREFTYLYP